ncbi:MAG TPA: MFS transporter [Xanthomonadaceae bacterium]|nr:MFS transporter [Xanthomonadaceae bacterium]
MTELALPAAPGSAAPTLVSPAHTRGLLLGLGLATGMEFYTFDSVNLVLADMTGTLGLSADEASWLLTVYSCSLFFGVPISIWLAGHVGYKRFLIATTILFAIASVGCAVSSSLEALLIWRAIQGLAGAGLVMWWRASVYLLMPKAQRSLSMMRISTVLFLSSASGLLASGYLTDRFSWRLIFVPNLFYAAGAICLLLRFYPNVPLTSSSRLTKTDWPGIVLLALALISLQIILNRGQIDDWFGSSFILVLTWTSVTALAMFLLWQGSARNPVPLLDLALVRDRRVMSSILIGLFTGMILSGSLFVLPEFLRNISAQTYSATQTGQIICVYALTAAAARPQMVKVIARIGQRKTIALALLMLIASMLAFQHVLTSWTPAVVYVLPLMLYGLCVSSLLPAVGSGTVARIEQDKLLDGVSLFMTFRQFGASLGVALLNILLAHRETLHSARLFEHLQRSDPATQAWLATQGANAIARGGYSNVDSHAVAIGHLVEAARHQAETLSYADAFGFMAVIGVIALCLIPIIPPTPVIRT